MEALSYYRVVKAAPAAAGRRTAARERLIDTAAFTREMHRQGYVPVFASQASTHSDATIARPEDQRHIVVYADPGGGVLCFALVNSHTKDRRPRLGFGFMLNKQFLIGPSFDLQRWKGYETELHCLLAFRARMRSTFAHLHLHSPSRNQFRTIVVDAMHRAYVKHGRNEPSLENFKWFGRTYAGVGEDMMEKCREGNLLPASGRRRVKALQSADSLFDLSQGIMSSLLVSAKRAGILTSEHLTIETPS